MDLPFANSSVGAFTFIRIFNKIQGRVVVLVEQERGLLNSKFSSTFFRLLETTPRIPSIVKCLTISALLYVPGLLLSFSQGHVVFSEYIMDFGFLASNMAIGLTLWALTRFFQQSDATIQHLNDVVFQTKDYEEFMRSLTNEKKRKDLLWYYGATIGLGFISFFLAVYPSHIIGANWFLVDVIASHSKALMFTYFIVWCTIVGCIIGITLFWRVIGSVHVLRKYCREFVSPEKILALAPDKTGGLGALGKLSFELDKAVSIPSIIIFAYVTKRALTPMIFPEIPGGGLTIPGGYLIGIIYTIFLAIIFFLPLSPVHNAMLEAKSESLNMIDSEYRKLYPKMVEEIKNYHRDGDVKSEYFHRAERLCNLYDRAKRMAVWPLNLGLISKFLITATIPLVGTFIVEVVVAFVLALLRM